jgi:hypothetical protein
MTNDGKTKYNTTNNKQQHSAWPHLRAIALGKENSRQDKKNR